MSGIKETPVRNFDGLIGGADPAPLEKILTLASGQGVLKRGTLLGVVTTSGNAKVADSASTDGSEVAKYILAEDVDTTDAATNAPAYMAGMFNREYLIFGGSDTDATQEENLRDVGIFLTSEKYFVPEED